jgi:hypothetical protein
MARTIEHNVTIEDVDVLPNGDIAAVVTLYTLIESKKVQGRVWMSDPVIPAAEKAIETGLPMTSCGS